MLGCAEKVAVRVIPPGDIDRNGLHKSNLAGLRAMLHALAPPAEACLVDGFRLGPAAPEHTAVVDGDEKSAAIAAASIVAKVTRDRLMRRLDALYPAYGFAQHVGYITPGTPPSCASAARRPCTGSSFQALCYQGEAAVRRAWSAAERRAARWYRLRGWRILGANVWAGGNELDLIVRRGRQLRFVEVKEKRGPRYGDPLEMVTAEKQRRVRRAAEAWLARPAGARRARDRLRRRRGARGPPPARPGRVLSAAVEGRLRGRHAGRAVRDAGSRPLVVGGRAPRARADEARPPAPPVPRASSSRSSWRCSSTATSRAGDHVLDPFAGSGTTLVQALESGLDATGVDIAAFNCLLMRVKTAQYDLGELGEELRDVAARVESLPPAPDARRRLSPRVVRAGGHCGAPGVPRPDPRVPARRRPPRHPLAGRAVGAPDGALRARGAEGAAAGRVLVSQAPARVPPRRVGLRLPPPLHARHARADRGRSRACAIRSATQRRARRLARGSAGGTVRRRPHVAAVSGADRLSRAAPLCVRAARARRPARAGDRRGGLGDVARGARGVPHGIACGARGGGR